MLDMTEINKEIKKLEDCGCTTYDVCNKLAILYIVRDHMRAAVNETATRTQTPAPAPAKGL